MFKNLKKYNPTSCDITMQASSNSEDSKLSKPWPPDQYWVLKRVQSSTKKYNGKMFNNLLLKNYNVTICEFTMQTSLSYQDCTLQKLLTPD